MATLAEGRKAVACSHPLDPKSILVGLCAGHRLPQGIGNRAQAPTCDHSQACFSRVIMLAFILLQILLAALAGLRAILSLPNMSLSLPYLSPCCGYASHAPAVMSAPSICVRMSAWRGVGLLGHEQIRFPWGSGTSP